MCCSFKWLTGLAHSDVNMTDDKVVTAAYPNVLLSLTAPVWKVSAVPSDLCVIFPSLRIWVIEQRQVWTLELELTPRSQYVVQN